MGRPRPLQQPIPIWIGGNATLTLRRVAERAQGWMPLTGPAGIFPTVRSPPASSIEDLRLRLQRLKDLAGDRFAGLDITVAYADPSVHDVTSDVERHRHAIGALRELGATWMVVPGPAAPHPHTLEFLQSFAATYFP